MVKPGDSHEMKIYLDGILLVKKWLTEAELQGSQAAPAFRRILEEAISKFEAKFKKK